MSSNPQVVLELTNAGWTAVVYDKRRLQTYERYGEFIGENPDGSRIYKLRQDQVPVRSGKRRLGEAQLAAMRARVPPGFGRKEAVAAGN